jgi:hypothetical protein
VETVRQVADRGLHGMVLFRLTESSIKVSSGPFEVGPYCHRGLVLF